MSNDGRDIPFVSSSILNAYIQCKWSFYSRYILNNGFNTYRNDDGDESIYLSFGTLVHETIAAFWQTKERRTINLLLLLYEQNIVSSGFVDKEYIKLGRELLQNFFDNVLYNAPKRKVVATELSFKVKIKGVPLHGTIDQIFYLGNGIYEIEDYKTSKWLPTQDEVDDNIQLSMYDLVFSNSSMKEHWYNGIKPKAIMLTLNFLRHGVAIHTERTEADREFTLNYFRMLYNQMRCLDEKKFTPCPNVFCSFCECDCPHYNEVINADESDELKKLRSQYDLSDVADKIEFYNALNNRIKILSGEMGYAYDTICQSLKESDSIIKIGDTEYFMAQSGARFVKMNRAIAVLEKHGLWNPMDFISSLPVGKLEGLSKEYPDVWEELEQDAIGFAYKSPQLKTRKARKEHLF